LVARLTPRDAHGRAFGSYGLYKSLGYTLGPLLGGLIVTAGGLATLFTVMTALALAVALWAIIKVPSVRPAPRQRQTLLDTVRRFTDTTFVAPTLALAAATASLSVGVGFLPASGTHAGLSPALTGAVVSVLALTTAIVQPLAGRALDAERLTTTTGISAGTALTALGLALAALPGLPGILSAAIVIGAGGGIITPLAFTMLARATTEQHLGQTMGAAEIGRECGDAAGPLIVGAVAAATSLPFGFLGLAGLVAAIQLAITASTRTRRT
jgi:MFS family permease